MDVETFYDGILAAIVVPEGEFSPVGAPIGLLAETEDEIAKAKAKANSSYSTLKAITPTSLPPTSNPSGNLSTSTFTFTFTIANLRLTKEDRSDAVCQKASEAAQG
jgi:pyruvate/2-oxoglutarate dehydrogenase complex dihydrolipoamide acyltransferase (E2) component